MKRLYNILIGSCLLSLNVAAQTTVSDEQSPAADSVKRIIAALPEVKALEGKYDSISNRVQHTIIKISAPDSLEQLYRVRVGYQGNNRYQPHFYFYLNPSDTVIYIEDLEHGDRTTLDEWRKRRALAGNQN